MKNNVVMILLRNPPRFGITAAYSLQSTRGVSNSGWPVSYNCLEQKLQPCHLNSDCVSSLILTRVLLSKLLHMFGDVSIKL